MQSDLEHWQACSEESDKLRAKQEAEIEKLLQKLETETDNVEAERNAKWEAYKERLTEWISMEGRELLIKAPVSEVIRELLIKAPVVSEVISYIQRFSYVLLLLISFGPYAFALRCCWFIDARVTQGCVERRNQSPQRRGRICEGIVSACVRLAHQIALLCFG